MDRESHQRAINHPVCLGGGGGSGLSHRGSRELHGTKGRRCRRGSGCSEEVEEEEEWVEEEVEGSFGLNVSF